jgi:hypothetical protein
MSESVDPKNLAASAAEANRKAQDQKLLEQRLNEEMQVKFAQNIAAFEKYMPEVADRFRDYKPKDKTIFLTKSGALNLLIGPNNNPLYSDDPVTECRNQVDNLMLNPYYSTQELDLRYADSVPFIHSKFIGQIYRKILNARKEHKQLCSIPDHLGTMIVFGVGLGYHLTELLERVTIDQLFICEPNADWLYASLYSCDWKKILETIDERDGCIHLQFGISYEKYGIDFINEIKNVGSFNATRAVIYKHYDAPELNGVMEQLDKNFHLLSLGWGFFDDGVISIAHDFANSQKQLPVLKHNAVLPPRAKSTPAFILANGPSLDNDIEVIKAHKGHAIIFSCGSVINTLLKHDIVPDFHLELERTQFTFDYLKELVDNDTMKTINFLTINAMHPKCTSLFKWTGIGFKPGEPSTVISSDFIDRNQTYAQLSFCNPVMANAGLSFACYMGFKEIYLFGVDCGYIDPAYHHSKDSLYYGEDGKEIESLGDLVRTGEVVVEGNFGENVFSTLMFDMGRFCLENLLSMFPRVNCYNCSNGAKINKTFTVHSDDLMLDGVLPDKAGLIETIKSTSFIPRDVSREEYEEWMTYDMFDEICQEMVNLIDIDFTTRSEIATALKEQVRYLFSYAHTKYRHIYMLLEGSLNYVQSVCRTILYGFDDLAITLKLMREALEIFKSYMSEACKIYRRAIDSVDETPGVLIDMFKEGLSDKVLDEEQVVKP